MGVPTKFMRDGVAVRYLDRLRALWSAENCEIRSVEIVVRPNLARPKGRTGTGEFDRRPGDHAQARRPVTRPQDPPSAGTACGRAVPLPPPSDLVDGPAPVPALPLSSDDGRPVNGRPTTDEPDDDAIWADDGGEDNDMLRPVRGTLDQRFTFDTFVVGKPNEFAHAAARRIAESETAPFNPLFLYGGVGLGKTHLMHAIAWELRRIRPDRRVLYLSAERFMYQFIRALRVKDTINFKQMFRSVDVLMVDDVQFISGKDATQEEFFHTFNALVDENRQVVVSADKSPSHLDIEDRLKSRLGWGLVADIHPTNYELRLGILQAKAERLSVSMPNKLLEFLAYRISGNVRELEGALNRLAAHAELVGRPVTHDSAQELLADILRASDRRLTIDEIQKAVATHFNIKVADMHSARRSRSVARPRQVAMYLAKQLTPRSLPEIGRMFGGRDHTTVIHAVRKVEELIAADPAIAEDVDLLRRTLES